MKRGEIYLLNLKTPNGSVQAGKRPVIVVQNDTGNAYSPTTIVCSITSKTKKHMPTHCIVIQDSGAKTLYKRSYVLCEQIFTVNTADLEEYLGIITNPQMLNRLNNCLCISLGLKTCDTLKLTGGEHEKN